MKHASNTHSLLRTIVPARVATVDGITPGTVPRSGSTLGIHKSLWWLRVQPQVGSGCASLACRGRACEHRVLGVFVCPGDMAKNRAIPLLNVMSDWRKARNERLWQFAQSWTTIQSGFAADSAYRMPLATPSQPGRWSRFLTHIAIEVEHRFDRSWTSFQHKDVFVFITETWTSRVKGMKSIYWRTSGFLWLFQLRLQPR